MIDNNVAFDASFFALINEDENDILPEDDIIISDDEDIEDAGNEDSPDDFID